MFGFSVIKVLVFSLIMSVITGLITAILVGDPSLLKSAAKKGLKRKKDRETSKCPGKAELQALNEQLKGMTADERHELLAEVYKDEITDLGNKK